MKEMAALLSVLWMSLAGAAWEGRAFGTYAFRRLEAYLPTPFQTSGFYLLEEHLLL